MQQQRSTRRRTITRSNGGGGGGGGSVWESRMKMDEIKGGIKVFTAFDNKKKKKSKKDEEDETKASRKLRRIQSDGVNLNGGDKRRNWRPPQPADKNSVQLLKSTSDLSNSHSSKTIEKYEVDEEEEDDDDDDEIEIDADVDSFDDKEIVLPPVDKLNNVNVEDEKEILTHLNQEEIEPQPQPVADTVKPNPFEMEEEEEEEEVINLERSPQAEAPERMRSIVDLVMWRDISRSAFVFGLGTFILISSSYTKDINFSFISATSYLGLFYLALIFLFKSILRRGTVDFDDRDERCIIGEEEAIWALRFLLPYINEVLLKLRALFSGDPATTMKLAMVLFVMARCGSCVTIWTLSKLVFFGVFTIPKVLSSYSLQLARYGKYWIERFRDGWESCTHKKAAAAALFTLIWNISSTVARIWAVFMLVVAVKLYKQYSVDWNEEEVEEEIVMGVEQQEEEQRQEDSKPRSRVRVTAAGINGLQLQQKQRGGPNVNVNALQRNVKVKKRT